MSFTHPMQRITLAYPSLEQIRCDSISDFQVHYCGAVQAVDMADKAIVDEVIRVAREAGIHELYLLDKQFIVEAITEKLARVKEEEEPE